MKILPFTKHYSGRLVLDFPGIELERGKIYAVIGANGSGKSTFAKILSGSVPADKKARYCDADSIGYMPQKNFAFRMSTKKNILLASKDEDRANKLMAALGLYAVDTVLLIIFSLTLLNNPASCLLEILTHGAGLALLWWAVRAASQLSRIPRPRPSMPTREES